MNVKLTALMLAAMMVPSISFAKDTKNTKSKGKASSLVSSNQMIGSYIYDGKNNEIADINSIVVNSDGKALFVIAGVGGLAGVGESQVAIPMSALECNCEMKEGNKNCRAVLSMTHQKLEKAPKLETSKFSELTDKSWLDTNADYFSAEAPNKAPKMSDMICVASVTDATVQPTNKQDAESVGHLDAVIFDVKEGKAKYGILGHGGTAGFGEEYVAVPFSTLSFELNEEEEYEVSINATQEQIDAAPTVTPEQYPELDLKSFRNTLEETLNN